MNHKWDGFDGEKLGTEKERAKAQERMDAFFARYWRAIFVLLALAALVYVASSMK